MNKDFNPLVSIVIPVYNGSNYMREAIDSALGQTYNNIEVLVINDGSDDGGKTKEIALSYGNKIRYFEKENGGVSTALNLGIREMKGEYFSWLSHDDYYAENRIEEDIKIINTTGYNITYSKLFIIDEKKKETYERKRILNKIKSPHDALLLAGVGFCSLTIKKDCFEKTGLFNENNKTMQDVEMVLLLSKYYNFIHNSNSVTYNRDHSNRGTYKQRKLHDIDSYEMGNFIKNNFTIFNFFKIKENMGEVKITWAYMKLGNTFRSLGSFEYANENYKLAYLNSDRKNNKAFIYYIIGAKRLNSIPFRIIYRIVNFFKYVLKKIRR